MPRNNGFIGFISLIVAVVIGVFLSLYLMQNTQNNLGLPNRQNEQNNNQDIYEQAEEQARDLLEQRNFRY